MPFPLLVFLPNVAGAIIGAGFYFAFQKNRGFVTKYIIAISAVGIALVAASFLFPGTSGVHRWILLGPLALNISMALSPLIIFGIDLILDRNHDLALAMTFAIGLVHALQPDAGQATSFAAGMLYIYGFKNRIPKSIRFGGIIITFILAARAWTSADPLEPVPQVEEILHVIAREGVAGVIASFVAIGLVLWPFAIGLKRRDLTDSSQAFRIALFLYFVTQFIVAELGHFPVPVIGAGAASVIGWFVALALRANSRAESKPAVRP